jgi:hypothetical protein
MEVSCELKAPAALPPEKVLRYPLDEAEWITEPAGNEAPALQPLVRR